MAFNFPSSPTTDQIYTSGGATYKWNGVAWVPQPGAFVFVSDTAPSGAPVNSLWWRSSTGVLHIYYNDGTSSQWVVVSPSGPAGPAAPYLQGSVIFDPPSMATNVVGAIQTMTVTGAVPGDFCQASFTTDLNGMTLLAWVSALDTVKFQFQNKTAGTLDLISGTVFARVWKQ